MVIWLMVIVEVSLALKPHKSLWNKTKRPIFKRSEHDGYIKAGNGLKNAAERGQWETGYNSEVHSACARGGFLPSTRIPQPGKLEYHNNVGLPRLFFGAQPDAPALAFKSQPSRGGYTLLGLQVPLHGTPG